MLMDARRAWNSSDNYVLNLFRKANNNNDQKIMAWLNYVTPENLISLVGEVPKAKKMPKATIKQVDEADVEEPETLGISQ